MRRLILAFGLLVFPVLSTTPVFAAGLFQIGETAPSFTLTAITGETVSLQSYKGKIVVLGLFHICEPCMIQGSALQKVYESMQGRNVAVLGVNSSGNG
ncbi:MAG: redoxin, partial [Nitrospira sp. LK265]|nr:redoxin [Nitrospira sp. LK265]